MGYSLHDRETREEIFVINIWHWGALCAAVNATGLAPPPRPGELDWDQPYVEGNGLDRDTCRRIAAVLRSLLLSKLHAGERLLSDGTITTEPAPTQLFRDPDEWWRNYGTNREVLEDFTEVLETCNGFGFG